MKTFQEIALPESLQHCLEHMQFKTPTPIQAEAIPPALEGKDILGSAQTGTGKTAAYGIPLVAHMINNQESHVLVMVPTRELAKQVITQLKMMMGKSSKIKTALLIGGEAMPKQLAQLRQKPRLIVGTPGRINDHIDRRKLSLKATDFLVLDEADRMIDMGFSIQIERILEHVVKERQTLLFSATLPANIERIAAKYLSNPTRIAVKSTSTAVTKIKQDSIRLKEIEKYDHLLDQLEQRVGSILIFINTKHGTEKMTKRLKKEGHSADAIHGDLRQNKRDKVISDFRAQKYRILIATDIAARGLDIPHIEHVINYDLPFCAEDYIHRIGRTARAGAEGEAFNLISPSDKKKWAAIERLMLDPEKGVQNDPKRNKAKKKRTRTDFSKKTNFSNEGKATTSKKRDFRKKKSNAESSFTKRDKRRRKTLQKSD